MKHEDVWRALDTLAAEKGLSPSGLARAAGLDPTTFNRSKRSSRAGLRWPSTESLSRALHATGASLEAFTALVGGARALTTARHHRGGLRHLPVLPLSRLGEAELFDEAGYPRRDSWEETEVPQPADLHGYAVRLDSARFEPAFRDGGTLIVSPEAPLGPGDRALLHGEPVEQVSIGVVTSGNGSRLWFQPLDAPAGLSVDRDGACRMHRIVWVAC